ncbi:MAG: zinc-binding dehydrogenase [Phycisphaerae bacterium]
MGADEVLDFTGHDELRRYEWVRSQTKGRGADVTIECTGSPTAATQALRFTRDAGRAVIVGQYTDHGETSFNPHLDLNRKHLTVRGCWGSDYSHFHRAVQMLRTPRGAALWSGVSLARYALSQVDAAMDAVAAGEVVKALVVPER